MRLFLFPLFLLIAACASAVPSEHSPRILAMGDSLLAWHSLAGKSVSDTVARELQEPVVDRSVSAARIIYKLPVSAAAGMQIRRQYQPGKWDWVIVNGGGNDLWLGCGCFACNRKLDKLVSKDGRAGAIPGMLSELRATGAKVIYVGYLRSPGTGSLIEHCRDEGNELEARIERLAELDKGIHFLSLRDMVPFGDRSYHALDMIHPSVKASNEIGQRVAEIIQAN
ncbi:GDSL family lipase [Leisingera methylohalidivorans DSM 14336]|uniref:GDSL family lipase n=1 Tax=Leisingera methylohalidivorans DSM 14336 TaxID=999552 RepID=V9VQ22_9RHOB|nr:SGNH/GDSL hydrolase family protein [Leisingera methylohalidivorans]AHC99429.1 GDSL family lipase [Leisingera methylohalidivorans DSM 14336]